MEDALNATQLRARLYRVLDEVIATGLPPEWVDSVRYSETLAMPEVFRLPTESYHSVPRDHSPTVPVMTAQDLVEPIMLDAARSYDGADVRFGTDLVALAQDPAGCRARIRDLATGDETDDEHQAADTERAEDVAHDITASM